MAPPDDKQKFGGSHTEKKLDALSKYASAYLQALSGKSGSRFRKIYIDGFAGCGTRYERDRESGQSVLDAEMLTQEASDGKPGSALRIASLDYKFDEFILVELNKAYAEKLKDTFQQEFPEIKPEVVNQDLNSFLQAWCPRMEWNHRALVFLDPYGMQVEWKTLQAIAKTKQMDMCVLIPISGVQRTLPHAGPTEEFAKALDRFFGTSEWRTEFYREIAGTSLFEDDDDGTETARIANYQALSNFMVKQLSSIFAYVSEKPILLKDRGVVLYVLCFATGSDSGKDIVKRIADHICKTYND